ncbi:Transcriptional regulatory protein ZraR [compost metagenome]|jgi:CheY-like chemotaxis protein|uniref:PglZ domain-containing protein n=2 Tax=Sphingobacterium TaxID=28453 RepID=A0ABX7CS71_SPHMU|nr:MULTISPECIES: bifunctional response regulator/alkaline phosphatase family protein [Sphingobacterium]QQT31065.1 PglZ domain-containing protein [Sphingobacterium multivorum]QQT53002.1 PglZ domain-containing protein [Sphingobacterium multivorum]QRY58128.1 PglZ domain-containing protein [Sphingobacterium siyangense]RKF40947.1 two-component system response regulator [Sphingobacterium siyangense]
MQKTHILWADDEIDFLKPHILFLESKGYKVDTVNNGNDAVEAFKNGFFHLVFLDENMPGLTGLETLAILKSINPTVPVVLVTKNEEEHVMEDAIGSKIDDYLIKPVNPKQILMTIKKLTENKRLVNEKTSMAYQQDFRNLGMILNDNLDFNQWSEVYKKLVYWELSLEKLEDNNMHEILTMQKSEANMQFSKFIENNYIQWINRPENAPILSHQLFKKKVFPTIEDDIPTFFFLIDNLRFDQWKIINEVITDYFRLEEEINYYSILPTATQYARNAIFSGLTPLEMEKRFPKLWQNDEDEGGKNLYEDKFLEDQIKRLYRKSIKHSYTKILTLEQGKDVLDNLGNLMHNQLNVLVYNFVDMLSHARTDSSMIRELANDEAAYRSLTLSWFEHSPLLEAIKWLSQKKVRVIITTDHGTIRVKKPSKIVGDRNTNTNLRYKQGKNLNYIDKDVFAIKNPHEAQLPKLHVSSTYVFAKEDSYFVYPNNYNQFVNYFNGTFQHGGISLEEMIIPFATYLPK